MALGSQDDVIQRNANTRLAQLTRGIQDDSRGRQPSQVEMDRHQ